MTARVREAGRPRTTDRRTGPLAGLRVIELAGLGPGPFCAMVLADLGAEVIRVERVGMPAARSRAPSTVGMVLTRGRPAIGVDLKRRARASSWCCGWSNMPTSCWKASVPASSSGSDSVPTVCLERNPRLIYGRITGYGREGPLGRRSRATTSTTSPIAGALAPIGRRGEAPVPPLNLIADFGGGGMLLAMGILAAVYERTHSGLGQVVDAAMVDGAALLTTMFHEIRGLSLWHDERGTNSMDTGSHYYNVYETADGEFVSVGAMEPRFYRSFMSGLGFSDEDIPPQDDQSQWESLKQDVAEIFRGQDASEWLGIFDGTDACVTPVLSLGEAPYHPHNRAARHLRRRRGGSSSPPPRHASAARPLGPTPRRRRVSTRRRLLRWGVTQARSIPSSQDGIVD